MAGSMHFIRKYRVAPKKKAWEVYEMLGEGTWEVHEMLGEGTFFPILTE